MILAGQVIAVWRRELGGQLTVPVVSTDTVLNLDALEDFTDDGGTVTMPDGRQLTYTAADFDAYVLRLTGAAGAAYSVEDRVLPEPAGVVYECDVSLADDDTDVVVATVPHYLIPLLGEGQVDPADPRAVVLDETSPGSLRVVDVVNRDPVVLGSYVDPGGLVPPPTDGMAPGGSPTPTVAGAIGALVVTWTGTPNVDPVTYEVHAQRLDAGGLGTDSPLVAMRRPDGRAVDSTWVGEVQGTTYWIRHLPDGEQVVAGVTYGVWLIARDDDGEAPASPTVQGSPAQATDADLAVGSVTADHIVAGAVTAEKLEAQLIIGNEIYAGDPETQHVVLSGAGIQLLQADQQPLVVLPTDPNASAWFRGAVEAVTLEILQGLTMRGVSNIMGPGSVLTLHGTLRAPLAAPTVTVGWERQTIGDPANGYRRVAWNPAGASGTGSWFVGIQTKDTENANVYSVDEYRASDMVFIRRLFALRWGFINGLACIGGRLYTLAQFLSTTYIDKYDAVTGAKISSADVSALIANGSNGYPVMETLGQDGADLLLADADPATFNQPSMTYRPRIRTITLSDTGVVVVTATVLCGSRDLDAWKPAAALATAENRYWILTGPADRFFGSRSLPWSKAGAVVADQDFGFPADAAGFVHDGTRFWSLVGGDLIRHTNWNWTTEPSRYWVGQTWYENVQPFVAALPAPNPDQRPTEVAPNGNG